MQNVPTPLTYTYKYIYTGPPRARVGPRANYKFGGPLTKIILADIALDKNTFIRFFTGEPEDNCSGEDTRVLAWLSVRASIQ